MGGHGWCRRGTPVPHHCSISGWCSLIQSCTFIGGDLFGTARFSSTRLGGLLRLRLLVVSRALATPPLGVNITVFTIAVVCCTLRRITSSVIYELARGLRSCS